MKPLVFSLSLILLVFLSPMQSFAGESFNGQELNYVGTGWGAEGIYVRTVLSNNSGGCGPVFLILPTHPMLKEIISILLSAFHTGAKVDLYVDGCLLGDRMNLKAVAVTK